jgi:hypothetical protein
VYAAAASAEDDAELENCCRDLGSSAAGESLAELTCVHELHRRHYR